MLLNSLIAMIIDYQIVTYGKIFIWLIMSVFHNVPGVPCVKVERWNACLVVPSFCVWLKKMFYKCTGFSNSTSIS
jgi:hypothetical protein